MAFPLATRYKLQLVNNSTPNPNNEAEEEGSHLELMDTTTETLICPGWETFFVPVSQLGTPSRDKRRNPFVPGLATGTKDTLLSRLVIPTGTKCFFSVPRRSSACTTGSSLLELQFQSLHHKNMLNSLTKIQSHLKKNSD